MIAAASATHGLALLSIFCSSVLIPGIRGQTSAGRRILARSPAACDAPRPSCEPRASRLRLAAKVTREAGSSGYEKPRRNRQRRQHRRQRPHDDGRASSFEHPRAVVSAARSAASITAWCIPLANEAAWWQEAGRLIRKPSPAAPTGFTHFVEP